MSEMRRPTTAEALGFALIFGALVVWAITIGWRPLSAWEAYTVPQSGDPPNIVAGALEVAHTGNVYATVDPPLRYVPIAIVYALVDASGILAERIAQTYATLMSFVGIPLALYALFRVVGDARVALLTALGFLTWRILDIGRVAYYNGYWHYSFVLPFVILALLFAHYAIVKDGGKQRLGWAALTGLIIGYVGLNQYVLAAYAAVAVAVVFLARRRFTELGVTGGVGAVYATALLLAPSSTDSFILNMAADRLKLDQWSLAAFENGVINIATTPTYLFIVVLTVVFGIERLLSGRPTSESGVVEGSILVVGGLWLFFTGLAAPAWFSQLAQYVVQYLLLGGIVTQGVHILDEHAIPGWGQFSVWLRERPQPPASN